MGRLSRRPKRGSIRPLGYPAGNLSGADADRFAARVVQIMGLYFLVSIVGEAVGRPAAGMYGQFVVTTVFVFLMFALFALPVGGRKIRLDRIGIGFSGFLRNAGWGLAAVAANIPVIVLLMVVASPVIRFLPEPTHPVQSELASNPQGVTLFIIFVLASLYAPLWEEVCFRGLLFQGLGRFFGSVAAGVVGSGFLFAAIHPQGMALWLALGWIGVMGALLTYQTRSLIPAIVMHAAHNSLVLSAGLVFSAS